MRGAYQGQLPRRGRYLSGRCAFPRGFRLGLVRHSLLVDELANAGGASEAGPADARLDPGACGRRVRDGQARAPPGSLEADYYGLRDWRSGDSRRWIHWRSTARRGRSVVRQFEERRSRDLAVLVDLWQPPSRPRNKLEHVETAVSFVATLIAEACRQAGRRLFLSLAAATFLERSGPASPLFFRQQMDELALVEPHHDAQFPRRWGTRWHYVPPATPTLLVSTRPIDWEPCAPPPRERKVAARGPACCNRWTSVATN